MTVKNNQKARQLRAQTPALSDPKISLRSMFDTMRYSDNWNPLDATF
jgi:hypothetical protein